MMSALRELWRWSALPILLVLAALLAGGAYLQSVAVRIQGAPLHVDVAEAPEAGARGEEAAAEAVEQADGDEPGTLSHPAAAALAALRQGRVSEGLAALGALPRAEAADPRLRVAAARALIGADRASDALGLLEGLTDVGAAAADVAFYRGVALQRAGKADLAAERYREALHARPTYFEAAFNLGTLLLADNRDSEAITILTAALPLAGGDKRSRTLHNLGIAYSRVDSLGEAVRSYQEAINLVPQNLKSRVNLAQLYRDRLKRPRDAQALYEEALKLDDRYVPALAGLAGLRQQQGKKREAEQLLERAVAVDPAFERARTQLAELLVDTGRSDQARGHLEWVMQNGVEHGGERSRAYFVAGRIEAAAGNHGKAASLYERAFAASGETDLESLNNMGLSLKALGRTAEAEKAFSRALEKKPDYAAGHYNLGLLHLEQEDLARAQVSFERAVAAQPEFAEAWYNLGLVHGQREAPYRAIEAYEQALRLAPSNPKARLNLAVQYSKIGQQARAMEQYRLIIAGNPSYAAAWYNLALAHKELGQVDEAEKAYKRAIELEPDEMRYRQNLAVLYAHADRHDEAAAVLTEALEIQPQSQSLRYNLALERQKMGDSAKAIQELELAVSLDPRYQKAWLALGDLRSDAGAHAEAAQAYEAALAAKARDPLTHYLLGKEYFRLDRLEDAVTQYRACLENVRDNAWVWYHLGKALQALKRDAEAKTAFNQSLALDASMGRFIVQRLGESGDSAALLRAMLAEDPRNTSVRLQLAELLLRGGNADEALKEINEGLRRDPDNPAVWLRLADLHSEQESYAEAERVLTDARLRFPTNWEIALELGRVLVQREKPKEALGPLGLAAAAPGAPAAAWALFGRTHYDLQDYAAAADALRRANALAPDDGDVALDLGKSLYHSKDYAGAIERLTRAKGLLPDYGWVDVWLGRTYARLEDYRQAEQVYRGLTERQPAFVQGWISLGDLAVKQNQPQAARRYFERALAIDPFHESTRKKLDRLNGR